MRRGCGGCTAPELRAQARSKLRAGDREWSRLLLELAGKVGLATMPMTDDPLWNAEEVRLRFSDDAAFRQAIADFYAPQGPIEDAAIRDLVNLPFRHFITTTTTTSSSASPRPSPRSSGTTRPGCAR